MTTHGDGGGDTGGGRRASRGLVERVGGAERVREILDRFYARLFADPWIGFFFAGKDRAAIVDGQLGFLLKAFGASDEFGGRHPSVAHRELAPIRSGHFARRLVVLREVLNEAGLHPDDVEAWLRVEQSMRRHVVR